MRTDYPSVITEDEATLRRVERQVRGRPTAVRVQALRLLQSGVAQSLDGCAALVGHSRSGGPVVGPLCHTDRRHG